jgi:tripeptide aminopeptidase
MNLLMRYLWVKHLQETKGYEGFYHVHHKRKHWRNCFRIDNQRPQIKFDERKEKVVKIVRKINKKFAKKFGEDIAIAEINDRVLQHEKKRSFL